jgi:hypothetical protein
MRKAVLIPRVKMEILVRSLPTFCQAFLEGLTSDDDDVRQ